MPFKTFTSATLPASDVNTFLMDQVVIQCLSTLRPTAVEGLVIYETDTDTLRVWEGSTWRAIWRLPGSYTPTLAGMAIGTGGSAANTADWSFSGGTLTVSGVITFGTSGTTFPGAVITASLPAGFTATSAAARPLGMCTFDDSGTAHLGTVRGNTTTTVRFVALNAAGTYLTEVATSTTIPFTWGAGDQIRWSATITGTF